MMVNTRLKYFSCNTTAKHPFPLILSPPLSAQKDVGLGMVANDTSEMFDPISKTRKPIYDELRYEVSFSSFLRVLLVPKV